MNKTVTINISGIIFHIEEDAYESLSKYLATIKGYFSNTDGGNEIMSDIEARIAELLQEKINASKQVVLMVDVDYVKNVMGKPEEFGAEQNKTENASTHQKHYEQVGEKIKRRLFRNPDEKAIGGVCSGLAAYFDIDTVWVRLAMFLLIFFGGLSLWVYIIMWLLIPEAKTTAEKFAMRGEAANVNNIFQSFKEEAEDVKNRFSKSGKEYSQQFYQAGSKVRSGAASLLYTLFNIVGRLVGLFLLMLGVLFLVGYIMALFGISLIDGNVDHSVSHWKSVILDSPSDYALGVIAFILVAGIPVFMMIYGGVKLLFRIGYSNRWLNMILGITWVMGLILGCYVTVTTVKGFTEDAKIKEEVELHGMGDTIVVKLNPISNIMKTWDYDNKSDLEPGSGHNHGNYLFGQNGDQLSIIGHADLDVIESTSDSLELVIYQTAKGSTKKEANENARTIKYDYHRQGNTLIFDEVFSVSPGLKFRAQELEMKLKLPVGKVIYFDKSVKHLLDDIDNTTNTWDGDMVSRRWIMTDKGLKCIDCDNLESNSDDRDEDRTKNITINGKGIRVNGKDAEVKIDEDGIRIRTEDEEIEIGKDGKKEKKEKD